MPDDVEVPLPGTNERHDPSLSLDDDADIETTLDPETAYCLANLIDAAKTHGLYPFGHTKPALKTDETARDDRSALMDFRDELRRQPGVKRVTKERFIAMGVGLGTGS